MGNMQKHGNWDYMVCPMDKHIYGRLPKLWSLLGIHVLIPPWFLGVPRNGPNS